jgi:hypothetical protein
MNAYIQTPVTLEDLKKIDYTGAKPFDYRIQSPYGDIDPEFIKVPRSMSQLRAAIFRGIATKHLRTNFSCIKEEPGYFKNENRFNFIGWYDEYPDYEGAALDFFIRGSNNNELMRDILKAIFEEKFQYLQPYRTTLFQFDLRLKLRLKNGEILEINNDGVGHFRYEA